MTVTGSSIAVGPWAAIVEVYAVGYIIPAVGFPPTIVITIFVEPAAIAVHKQVSYSNQHKGAHQGPYDILIKIAVSIEIIAPADPIKSASIRFIRIKISLNWIFVSILSEATSNSNPSTFGSNLSSRLCAINVVVIRKLLGTAA
jgi:hypothetical protein